MRKSKCPLCVSSHTIKYGIRKGVQLYRCMDCGYQFRNSHIPSEDELWCLYQERKQTVSELAAEFRTSASTIKRRLRGVSRQWVQPLLSGCGFVHIDATYWGHNWGILLAIDEERGYPLYLSFIRSETVADYKETVSSIEGRGYDIRGIVIDGKQALFMQFSSYKLQMCQFHMKQITRRYLTLNPRLKASRALKGLVDRLTVMAGEDFAREYAEWKSAWQDTLHRRSTLKSGRTRYTHRRLRSAVNSIDFYLPYLFTYQREDCRGMPNTNNKIEGMFTDLKRKLNNHSGMTKENRKRFICGFFLALKDALSMEKERSQPDD